MTDFRSVSELEVYRADELVGHLFRTAKGCLFRYTDEFLGGGEKPVALHLPKTAEGISVEGVANLPTFFAGLLPEGVMFSAVRNLIGSAADDLFAILAATGGDAIGDVEVRIPGEPKRKSILTLKEATEVIQALLKGREGVSPKHLAAIAGVQPKLSLGQIVRSSRSPGFIVKFPPADLPDLNENEFSSMKLAKRCGLQTAEVQLKPGALLVKRFDRVYDGISRVIRKVHVEDMCQFMDRYPNSKYSLEYGELLEAMQKQHASKATLLAALRLYCFSYIIGNGDLHAKNVSLILDEGMWHLTPAYDLLSTLPYGEVIAGSDRMALALSDESFGRFSVREFVKAGSEVGLPARAVEKMVVTTAGSVLKHVSSLEGVVPDETTEVIRSRARSLL